MQKRDTVSTWKCHQCGCPVIDHNDTVVVTVRDQLAFFHVRCYKEWKDELEHIRIIEEGFG
jgi:hypothetical protein